MVIFDTKSKLHELPSEQQSTIKNAIESIVSDAPIEKLRHVKVVDKIDIILNQDILFQGLAIPHVNKEIYWTEILLLDSTAEKILIDNSMSKHTLRHEIRHCVHYENAFSNSKVSSMFISKEIHNSSQLLFHQGFSMISEYYAESFYDKINAQNLFDRTRLFLVTELKKTNILLSAFKEKLKGKCSNSETIEIYICIAEHLNSVLYRFSHMIAYQEIYPHFDYTEVIGLLKFINPELCNCLFNTSSAIKKHTTNGLLDIGFFDYTEIGKYIMKILECYQITLHDDEHGQLFFSL